MKRSMILLLLLSACGGGETESARTEDTSGGEQSPVATESERSEPPEGAERDWGDRSPDSLRQGRGLGQPPGNQSVGEEHGHGHAHHHHHGEGAHHDFSDVERFAAIFDAADRDEWQKPEEVVSHLEAPEGGVLVDLGAGTGYFLPHLANAATDVQVLALDTEPAMLAHMRERIEEAGLANVRAATCETDDPGLDAASVDRILIVDTWHHIADREAYAAKLHAALREGGSVLIVDFTLDAEHGPPAEMRLAAETAVAELDAAGFAAEVVVETLPNQWIVRGRR